MLRTCILWLRGRGIVPLTSGSLVRNLCVYAAKKRDSASTPSSRLAMCFALAFTESDTKAADRGHSAQTDGTSDTCRRTVVSVSQRRLVTMNER